MRGMPALPRPAAVAVHDDGDVRGQPGGVEAGFGNAPERVLAESRGRGQGNLRVLAAHQRLRAVRADGDDGHGPFHQLGQAIDVAHAPLREGPPDGAHR